MSSNMNANMSYPSFPVFEQTIIVRGERGDAFKNFLIKVLKRGNMRSSTIEKLLDEEGIEVFTSAFTHKSADTDDNYEYLELVGDSIVNCCIVQYINERFPQLRHPDKVKIVSRLKINLIAKKSFCDFAKKLDMWRYVTASKEVKNTKMKKTLEDVFEAFFGAAVTLINDKSSSKNGYNICYNIIKSLFDEIHISLKYEDLFDAKTRLKETYDTHKNIMGKIETVHDKVENFNCRKKNCDNRLDNFFCNKCDIQYCKYCFRTFTNDHQCNQSDVINFNISKERSRYQVIKIFSVIQNRRTFLGQGTAALKIDAEQKACESSLQKLKHRYNIYRPIPEIFNDL